MINTSYFIFLTFSIFIFKTNAFESVHPLVTGKIKLIQTSLNISNQTNDSPCEDLYQAACIADKDPNHFQELTQEIIKKQTDNIRTIKDYVAEKLGHRSYKGLLLNSLSSKNIIINSEKYSEREPYFLALDYDYYAASELIPEVESCTQAERLLGNVTEENADSTLEKLLSFKVEIKERTKLIIKSFPQLFIQKVEESCFSVGDDQALLKNKCTHTNFSELSVLVLKKDRTSIEYLDILHELFYSKIFGESIDPNYELSGENAYEKITYNSYLSCHELQSFYAESLYKESSRLSKKIHLTKHFIEKTIETIYSDKLKKEIQSDFDKVRAAVFSFLSKKYPRPSANLSKASVN